MISLGERDDFAAVLLGYLTSVVSTLHVTYHHLVELLDRVQDLCQMKTGVVGIDDDRYLVVCCCHFAGTLFLNNGVIGLYDGLDDKPYLLVSELRIAGQRDFVVIVLVGLRVVVNAIAHVVEECQHG